eukprot:1161634-Pelagomonas_calceolata.AAC.7
MSRPLSSCLTHDACGQTVDVGSCGLTLYVICAHTCRCVAWNYSGRVVMWRDAVRDAAYSGRVVMWRDAVRDAAYSGCVVMWRDAVRDAACDMCMQTWACGVMCDVMQCVICHMSHVHADSGRVVMWRDAVRDAGGGLPLRAPRGQAGRAQAPENDPGTYPHAECSKFSVIQIPLSSPRTCMTCTRRKNQSSRGLSLLACWCGVEVFGEVCGSFGAVRVAACPSHSHVHIVSCRAGRVCVLNVYAHVCMCVWVRIASCRDPVLGQMHCRPPAHACEFRHMHLHPIPPFAHTHSAGMLASPAQVLCCLRKAPHPSCTRTHLTH